MAVLNSGLNWQPALRQRWQAGLPGLDAHERMVPPERRPHLRNGFPDNRKLSAVLVMLYQGEEGLCTPLIVRNAYNGVHSKQIAFPGGKLEPSDPGLLYTALRETHEEVGYKAETSSVLGELTRLYIPPSGFEVVPFLCVLDTLPQLHANPREVSEILYLPLHEVRKPEAFSELELQTSRGLEAVPAFIWQQHTIWGATAMVLNELLELTATL